MIKLQNGNLTKEQIEIEKEHKRIIDSYESGNISEKEGNSEIEILLKNALLSRIINKEDIKCYNQRRDPPSSYNGTRSHMEFALHMKKTHLEENKTFQHLVNVMEARGHNVQQDSFGSDEKGYIMISNFWDRKDTPTNPDRKINFSGTWRNVEVKNFKREIWIKMNNLKKYIECQAYILINFDGLYYIFGNKTASYLLKNMSSPPQDRKGKPSLIINKDGNNAHYSLKQLIEIGAVKNI